MVRHLLSGSLILALLALPSWAEEQSQLPLLGVGWTSAAGGVPTLALYHGNTGMTNGRSADGAIHFKHNMEPSGFPNAVTTGETIFFFGRWPDSTTTTNSYPVNLASHVTPTFSDDKSNTYSHVFTIGTCQDTADSTNPLNHDIYFAQNVAANTTTIDETYSNFMTNQQWSWGRFYNMATSVSGFVDGSSCLTGVLPANNTAPNITGTAYNTTQDGDLILTCVWSEYASSGGPNTYNGVTFPTNFTGLEEETSNGHACAYWVQTTHGSFTPTFTISQTTHDHFTIFSAAFRKGSGGSAPSAGARVLLYNQFFFGANGSSFTQNLPCPSGTKTIAVTDDTTDVTGFADSSSHTYSKVTQNGGSAPQIFYTANITIPSTNTFTVTASTGSAGQDLMGLYCLNTTAIDGSLAPANTSVVGSVTNSSFNNVNVTTAGTVTNYSDLSSWTPGQAGDLVILSGSTGNGPFASCQTTGCVFDSVWTTAVANWTGNPDSQNYSNGDATGHYWANSSATVNLTWGLYNNPSGSSDSILAVGFK